MNPRTAFIAAPLLTFAYGVIRILDGLDGSRGPGLAWTTGHLAFLGAMVAFVFVFAQMRRLAGRDTLSTVAAVLGTAERWPCPGSSRSTWWPGCCPPITWT